MISPKAQLRLYRRIEAIVNMRVPYEDIILKGHSREDHYTTVLLRILDQWGDKAPSIPDEEIKRIDVSLWYKEKLPYILGVSLVDPSLKPAENKLEDPLTVSPVITYLIEEGKERFYSLTS